MPLLQKCCEGCNELFFASDVGEDVLCADCLEELHYAGDEDQGEYEQDE